MLAQFLLGGHGSLLLLFFFFVCFFFPYTGSWGQPREEEEWRRWLEWRRINRHSGGGLIATPLLIDPLGFNPLSLVCIVLSIYYFFFYCQVKSYISNRKKKKRNTSAKNIKRLLGQRYDLSVTFHVLYLLYLLPYGFSRWSNPWNLFVHALFLDLLRASPMGGASMIS